jgi:hypothetical protein
MLYSAIFCHCLAADVLRASDRGSLEPCNCSTHAEKGCILSYCTDQVPDDQHTGLPVLTLKPSSPLAWVHFHPGYNQVTIPSSLPSVSVYLLQSIFSVSFISNDEWRQKGQGDILLKLFCVFSPVFLFFLVHFLCLCSLLI